MNRKSLWVLVAMSLSAPELLRASEPGGSSPFAGDIGNALWTLIVFVLVILVLGKFAWGPILDALQKREDFIRESLAEAKRDRDQAEARLLEYTEKLNAARAEATAIVDEGRRDAEVVKRKIEEETRAEADKMIARAKREIGIATETAVRELYTTGARLATEVAARILGRELTAEDHERLVAESLEEIRNQAESSEGS
jgi:F-type H+-transporting ATPase subunit b